MNCPEIESGLPFSEVGYLGPGYVKTGPI